MLLLHHKRNFSLICKCLCIGQIGTTVDELHAKPDKGISQVIRPRKSDNMILILNSRLFYLSVNKEREKKRRGQRWQQTIVSSVGVSLYWHYCKINTLVLIVSCSTADSYYKKELSYWICYLATLSKTRPSVHCWSNVGGRKVGRCCNILSTGLTCYCMLYFCCVTTRHQCSNTCILL